jgi:transcriptional regulator with XRE-family HTH domain
LGAALTGSWIRDLRQRAGLEPAHFALLLGVNSSTLYRWEKVGAANVRVEPLQRQLMAVLDQELGRRGPEGRNELRKTVLEALLVGGGLLGLYRLLHAAFGGARALPVAADSAAR